MEKENTTFQEISIVSYLATLNKNKFVIMLTMGVLIAATALLATIMTPTYEASAVIGPVGGQNEVSSLTLLAAQFGMTSPVSPNMNEIVSLLNSNILREKLIKKHNLLPVLLNESRPSGKTDEQEIWSGLRRLKTVLRIQIKQKENAIEISMQSNDPHKAAEIVNFALLELNDHMSSEAKRVADTNRRYLESQIDKTLDPFIKAKIYQLVAQQIEKGMMAEVKENFAFKVLDPPKAPDKPIKPRKLQMLMLSFIVSLFVGIFLAFIREYLRNTRETST